MKTPKRLQPLVDEGLIDEVLGQLMSGKEATVYTVRCGAHIRCAKVYKEANQRSFKQSAAYLEGRKTKNSRQARALEKGSRYGRQLQEETWQNSEIDALYRLATAGVRVPKPYICTDGVLLMDLVTDENGRAAPRLNDVSLSEAEALKLHQMLLDQVILMLCAGMIHGDLSEYNILVDSAGLVIIDLPQAIDAAGNNHAEKMFKRDVENLTIFFSYFAPELTETQYAAEIWKLYESGDLKPDSALGLTGKVIYIEKEIDLEDVIKNIESAQQEEDFRRMLKAERDADE
ncbi:serine/threonine protein kinase [Gammaproteobacteria bacterium]|nr:serine/threonine protein kinase [Gammaproteobacteria bacterium]